MAAAGRPAGTINKNSQFLLNRLQDMYGEDFHPIMKIAQNCATIQKEADNAIEEIGIPGIDLTEDNDDLTATDTIARSINLAKLANEQWEKLAPYIAPKLKAIEISGDPDNPLQVEAYELTPTQRAARIATLLEQARAGRDGHSSDGGSTDMDESTGSTSDGSD